MLYRTAPSRCWLCRETAVQPPLEAFSCYFLFRYWLDRPLLLYDSPRRHREQHGDFDARFVEEEDHGWRCAAPVSYLVC